VFTPSAVIGMWFRGLIAVTVVAAAVCLIALWYSELPPPDKVRPLPNQQVNEADPPRRPLDRIAVWRPGLDKPTALLTGALFLSMVSLGAGRLFYPLLRRPGNDEPRPCRSDRRSRLRRPDGTELNIEEFGKPDGPAVILTHGWGTDSTEWYYAKKELAKEHRVVVWDLPGAGHSTRALNNDYSIERFATDLQAIVEWSGASRIVMVGHSIGGMILQTYARLFPTEPAVAGLALVHTTYTNPIRTTKHGTLYSAIEKPVIVPLLYLTIVLSPLVWLMNILSYLNGSTHRSTEKQSFTGNETRGQLDFTARFVLVQSPAVLAKGMLGMIHFDESACVKTIAFPTAVVAAEEDPVTLPSASRFLKDSIPDAYCVTIPKGRHQAHMEMNDSFLGALKAFIRNSLSGDAPLKSHSLRGPLAGTKNTRVIRQSLLRDSITYEKENENGNKN
jgi:pimeloyl-ACP methyl ester carboxylesterase